MLGQDELHLREFARVRPPLPKWALPRAERPIWTKLDPREFARVRNPLSGAWPGSGGLAPSLDGLDRREFTRVRIHEKARFRLRMMSKLDILRF